MTTRTKGPLKAEIANQLINALVPYMEKNGVRDISPYLVNTGALRAKIGGVEVLYLPKAARLTKIPPPHLIDIWIDGGSKVFSAWFDPVDVVSFSRGEWVDALLADLNGSARYIESATVAA